jgi:hypothetical protein
MMTLGIGLGLTKNRKPLAGGSSYNNSFLGPSGQEIFQPDGVSIFLQPS